MPAAEPENTAMKAFYAEQSATWDAERRMFEAAEDAIREAVANATRGTDVVVHSAVFEDVNDYDGYDLSFVYLLDEKGQIVVLDGDAESDLDNVLNEMGDALNDFDYNQSSFEHVHDDADELNRYRIDVTPRVSARGIEFVDRELEAANAKIAELLAERDALSVEGFARTVQQRFGSAETAFFLNTEGGPSLVCLLDGDEDAVWDLEQETSDGDYESARFFIDSLHPYTKGLDVDGPLISVSRVPHADFVLDLRSTEV